VSHQCQPFIFLQFLYIFPLFSPLINLIPCNFSGWCYS
jgi:hypothetical protein